MKESADLKDFIMQRYGELGHAKGWSREDGTILIGSDPKEWTEGYEDIVVALESSMETDDFDGYTLVPPENLRAFSEGNIGWCWSRVAWKRKDGTEVPGRVTAVYRKEGDEWTVVQAHWSIGIPNKEVFG